MDICPPTFTRGVEVTYERREFRAGAPESDAGIDGGDPHQIHHQIPPGLAGLPLIRSVPVDVCWAMRCEPFWLLPVPSIADNTPGAFGTILNCKGALSELFTLTTIATFEGNDGGGRRMESGG